MKRGVKTLLAALGILVLGSPLANALVTFTWATVGNPGNAADPLNSGNVTGIGSVAYTYRMATTEVNLSQYTEFLNVVDPDGTNSLVLYNDLFLENDPDIAGISYTSGAASGSKYAVIGSGNRPVTYVSWNSAARFVNWLHNGQGSGGTESGVYDMSLGMPTRSGTATYWIPSEDEWYKAAYYDPTPGAGGGDNYWLYPTRSDSAPGQAIGSAPNNANYNYATGDSPYLTDGGAFSGSASFYGTFDQAGNVTEWNEAVISGSNRGLRGGSWFGGVLSMRSSTRNSGLPTNEYSYVGFRVATVPEPSTFALLVLVGAGLLVWKRRKATV